MNTTAPRTSPSDRTATGARSRGVRIGPMRTAGTAAALCLTVLSTGVGNGAAPAAAAASTVHSGGAHPTVNDSHRSYASIPDHRCAFDPKYLPRTPDAVEGWYSNCLARAWTTR